VAQIAFGKLACRTFY